MAGTRVDATSQAAGRGLAAGSRVGGYSIGHKLGAGAMGAVYCATDDGGTEVALKLIPPALDTDPTARQLMAQEVAALQRLRHPNVARVLDAELDGSEAFVVTELIPGKPLDQEILDGGPLDPVDLHELAEQLASALVALEAAGVVHRDIKPSNIIVGENGPVLIDFGIAAVENTGPGQPIMGTPGYLAPELLAGAPPSAATDWWSWAAVLAFAGTGRLPFGHGASDEVLHREIQGRADVAGLPARTRAALLGALEANPAARTAPGEVLRALRHDAAVVTGAPTQVISPALANTGPLGTRIYEEHELPPTELPPTGEIPKVGLVGAASPLHATTVLPPFDPDATSVIDMHATQVLPPVVAPMAVAAPAAVVAPAGRSNAYGDAASAGYALAQHDGVAAVVATPSSSCGPVKQGTQGLTAEPFRVYERPVLRKRHGLMLALAAPFMVAAAQAPLLAFIVFAVAVIVFRVFGTFVNDLHLRRELAGQVRHSDAAVVAARSPLTLLRGIIGALPQLLVGLCSGLLTMAAGWWVFGANGPLRSLVGGAGATGGDAPTTAHWIYPAILVFAMAVALVVTWFGTHSWLTRYGARSVFNTIAPGRFGLIFIVVALAIAAYLLIARQLTPAPEINWWPGFPPPLL